jgi:hypothetical protein
MEPSTKRLTPYGAEKLAEHGSIWMEGADYDIRINVE